MIGLVVVTHSRLAEEFLNASEMILGPLAKARAVCIGQGDSVENVRRDIAAAVQAVDAEGDGVIIMTDLFGGTPANISISLLEPGKVEVVTGANLPMILKFFNRQQGFSLTDLTEELKAYGRRSISRASDFLHH